MGGKPWVINSYNDDNHIRVAIDFLKMVVSRRYPGRVRLTRAVCPGAKKGMEAEEASRNSTRRPAPSST